MRHTFLDLAASMAERLKRILPGARSDPFFEKRTLTHFLNGVDSPHLYEGHVAAVEGRLERQNAKPVSAIPVRKRVRAARKPKPIPMAQPLEEPSA